MITINRLIKCNKKRAVKKVIKFAITTIASGIAGQVITELLASDIVIPAYLPNITNFIN